MQLMEAMVERENMLGALKRVEANREPGVFIMQFSPPCQEQVLEPRD